jgi:hypothetical protein
MTCATCHTVITSVIGVLLEGALPRVVLFCDTCCASEDTPERQLGFCAPALVPVYVELVRRQLQGRSEPEGT